MVIRSLRLGSLLSVALLWLAPLPALAHDDRCGPWPEPQQPVMQMLQTCAEPPITRRLGDVCTEVRWLCGDHGIEVWIDRLMTQSTAEWLVHRLDKGLVFAQWSSDSNASVAIFWSPENQKLNSNEPGLRLMVSRLRAMDGRE